MKKFIFKLLIALGLATLVTALFYLILFVTRTNINVNFLGDEVLYVVDKAPKNSGCTRVMVGDSVSNQLWPQRQSGNDICYLGSNQAITPAGDYLLLYHYLEANPQTREAYLVVRPQSLSNDVNLDKSFQYFIIPFASKENLALLDSDTIDKMNSRFGSFWVSNRYAQWTILNSNFLLSEYMKYVGRRNPDMAVNNDNPTDQYYHRISPTGQIYLNKIRALCAEKNVTLTVVPSPLMDTPDNYGWEAYSKDIEEMGFEDILGTYLEDLDYYPEDMFMDGIHFSEEVLNDKRAEIAEKLIPAK